MPTLRWSLQHRNATITCQLDVRGSRSYELCVVPHWDPTLAVIERYEAPARAFLRHAEVAGLLRERGWTVIDHVSADRLQGAA